mmetsp:Transcript_14755/g.13354  ORF Transcript_14755/g.13354 Transcript_14755/m.13354 type:complete len:125 (+) Transcript_14755:120-494(+)
MYIYILMIKLKNTNESGLLRQLSDNKLIPILPNNTRWSSKYQMLKRYIKIVESGFLSDMPNIQMYLLTPGMNRIITRILEEYKYFEASIKYLQKEDLTLGKARIIFDEVLQRFPHLHSLNMKFL